MLGDGGLGTLEQTQRGAHHRRLPLAVARRTQRAAHRMIHDEGAGHTHELWDVSEAPDVDPDGGYADRLDGALDVSHGHVAHRSNGHEEHRIGTVAAQRLGPGRGDVALQSEL